MSDTRTDTARDHDDSALIEDQDSESGAIATSAGGALARDVGSQDDMADIDDPDAATRATKQDDIDAGIAESSNRASGGDAEGLSDD